MDDQSLAHADGGAFQVVPSLELGHFHPVLSGNGAKHIATFHPVHHRLGLVLDGGGQIGFVGAHRLFLLQKFGHLFHRPAHREFLARPRHDFQAIHGVQNGHFRFGKGCHGRHLVEPQRPLYHQGVHRHRPRKRFLWEDAVVGVVLHQVHHGNEVGHVVAGFFGQERPHLPVIGLASRTTNRLVDIARTRIVGRQSEIPISVHPVQSTQVTTGSFGGQQGVLSFVHIPVDAKSFRFRRVVHELPQAACARRRPGLRVQAAFHHRQVLQLDRQPLPGKHFLEQREVHRRTAQHGPQVMGSSLAVRDNPAMRDGVPAKVQLRQHVQRSQLFCHKGRIQVLAHTGQAHVRHIPERRVGTDAVSRGTPLCPLGLPVHHDVK